MSEVERLSGIVGSLRDVYRPRADVKFQPTPIAPLLADVAMLLEAHLRRNKVIWEKVPSDADFVMINGFPDQLKQVFLNLSLNAIEAMQPDGGSLTVMTTINENEKQLGIAFSDSGPGISEDAMKFIFEPFYTSKESGMGLGLSICYDITQNHNGHITVENNPDAGATFTVWLPQSETRAEIPNTGE
jgi:two-component system sensor histidine kinase HydH